jgi:hypothetical protein
MKWTSWLILIMGLMLVIMPFGMGMNSKAADGAAMMRDFDKAGLMTESNVQKMEGYINMFKSMIPGMKIMAPTMGNMLSMVEKNQPPEAVAKDPAAVMLRAMKDPSKMETMVTDFDRQVAIMKANVGRFSNVKDMPMALMPWMFIGTGLFLVILAGLQLLRKGVS